MKPLPTVELRPGPMQGVLADMSAPLSLAQVAQLSGVGTADLKGLVDYGVLTPLAPVTEPWVFRQDCVMTLQRANHLRQDLALDDHGFALAMMLLSQITHLEGELRTVHPGLLSVHAPS